MRNYQLGYYSSTKFNIRSKNFKLLQITHFVYFSWFTTVCILAIASVLGTRIKWNKIYTIHLPSRYRCFQKPFSLFGMSKNMPYKVWLKLLDYSMCMRVYW